MTPPTMSFTLGRHEPPLESDFGVKCQFLRMSWINPTFLAFDHHCDLGQLQSDHILHNISTVHGPLHKPFGNFVPQEFSSAFDLCSSWLA